MSAFFPENFTISQAHCAVPNVDEGHLGVLRSRCPQRQKPSFLATAFVVAWKRPLHLRCLIAEVCFFLFPNRVCDLRRSEVAPYSISSFLCHSDV